MYKTDRIWITWEKQRRNQTLSAELQAELHELLINAPRPIKYCILLVRTFMLVFRKRPRVLFVQNPSIVLSAFAVILARIFSAKLVVDEHNAGLFPLEGKSKTLNKIAQWIVRKSDYVIVTNENLLKYVSQWGGRGLVLPDPLPKFQTHKLQPRNDDKFKVTFVCTWAADEPYMEVIDAAKDLEDSVNIYMTGRYSGKINPESLSKNVILTGFLSDQAYVDLLNSSNAVMVLTTRDDCLNCGAYEAISLGKPVVLSDTAALRAYFRQGTVFVRNDKQSIVQALLQVKAQSEALTADAKALKQILSAEWGGMRQALEMGLH